jgi:hypothetical protein
VSRRVLDATGSVAGLAAIASELGVVQRERPNRRVRGEIRECTLVCVVVSDRVGTACDAEGREIGVGEITVTVRGKEDDTVDAVRSVVCVSTGNHAAQRVPADVPSVDRRRCEKRGSSVRIEDGEVQPDARHDDGERGVADQWSERGEVGIRMDASAGVEDEAGDRLTRRGFEDEGVIALGEDDVGILLDSRDTVGRAVKRAFEVDHSTGSRDESQSEQPDEEAFGLSEERVGVHRR